MSSLEKRIEHWRRTLGQSGTIGGASIEELENHLREEIGSLQRLGLTEQEAFLVARCRLGDTTQLQEEFAKVDGNRRVMEHLSSMAMGVLLFLLASYISNGISRGGLWLASLLDLHGYTLGAVGVATKIVTIVGLLLLGYVFIKSFARSRSPGRSGGMSVPQAVLFFLTMVLLIAVTIGGQLLFNLLMARSLGATDLGQAYIVMSYSDLAWRILAPVLIGTLFVVTRIHIQRHRHIYADT